MKNLAQIMFEMDNQDELLQFIPTGIPEMDYVTFFLCRGKLSILAARPGMGKTSIAVQIAQSVANRGMSVVWITNDHSCKQVAKLFDEYALPVNAQARIRIEDRITEINGVCNAIRKLEKQPDLIVVDYLQRLYRISQKGNSVLDSETACTALHDLAQSTNASILVLSGIKRSVETRNNHMPRCEDILGWERIQGNIENACVFMRNGYYEDIAEDDIPWIRFDFRPSVDRCSFHCMEWNSHRRRLASSAEELPF